MTNKEFLTTAGFIAMTYSVTWVFFAGLTS